MFCFCFSLVQAKERDLWWQEMFGDADTFLPILHLLDLYKDHEFIPPPGSPFSRYVGASRGPSRSPLKRFGNKVLPCFSII